MQRLLHASHEGKRYETHLFFSEGDGNEMEGPIQNSLHFTFLFLPTDPKFFQKKIRKPTN